MFSSGFWISLRIAHNELSAPNYLRQEGATAMNWTVVVGNDLDTNLYSK